MSYGGYDNYQTWNVYRRLADEEGPFWAEQAAILWDEAKADDTFSRSEAARFALAHALEEDRRIVGDIYGPVFSNVNWGKIAGAFLEGCKGYEPPTPRTKRRWYQGTLLPLLALTVIVAIPCGWLASSKVQKARQQVRQEREAVEAIEALGGYVVYGHQLDTDGKHIAPSNRPGRSWLRRFK